MNWDCSECGVKNTSHGLLGARCAACGGRAISPMAVARDSLKIAAMTVLGVGAAALIAWVCIRWPDITASFHRAAEWASEVSGRVVTKGALAIGVLLSLFGLGVFVSLVICWIALPFIIISKANEITRILLRIEANTGNRLPTASTEPVDR